MFVPIANTPRDYAWGSTTAIAGLLGTRAVRSAGGGTVAGRPPRVARAHPLARSRRRHGTLADWVAGRRGIRRSRRTATAVPAQAPRRRRPALAAGAPVAGAGRDGFERENAAGIPLDAADRNYKDAFHKPELIFALSDDLRRALRLPPGGRRRPPMSTRCSPSLACRRRLARRSQTSGRRSTARTPTSSEPWSARCSATTCSALVRGGDGRRGIGRSHPARSTRCGCSPSTTRATRASWSSLLINRVTLRAGEVLYLPAGNIHAYLRGFGVELMAASDNVLRGGLTPKHIDVPELLSVLDFTPLPVPYLEPERPACRRRALPPGRARLRARPRRARRRRAGRSFACPGRRSRSRRRDASTLAGASGTDRPAPGRRRVHHSGRGAARRHRGAANSSSRPRRL